MPQSYLALTIIFSLFLPLLLVVIFFFWTKLKKQRATAIKSFKESKEFEQIIKNEKEKEVQYFKAQPEYQKLLQDSFEHKSCDERRKIWLQDLKQSFEKKLVDKEKELQQLQEEFNFEKRYKNVSNIGEQLVNTITANLTESFLSNDLININSNPPLKKVPGKKDRKVKTDVLLEVFSPLQRDKKILTIVIEAKNQKPDTLEPQKNKSHFGQLFDQIEAYEADYALLVTELEPENSYLTISPIDNKDNAFMLRLNYLIGFLKILIRFIFQNEYYGQKEHKTLKSRENLIRIIDAGQQEIEEKHFRYLNDGNKSIRDKCDNISKLILDIDELTNKNDRRLKSSSKKLLSFYQEVSKEIKEMPQQEVKLLEEKN